MMKTRIPYSPRTIAQRAGITLLACGTLLCGCKKRPFSYPDADQPVYLSIAEANWSNGSTHIVPNSNNAPDSKAINSGNGLSTQFSEGDRLGLFLRGDSYEPIDNRIVTYTPEEGEIITKWVIDGNPIGLNNNEATLTAYFPYSAYTELAMNAIPLNAGPYDVNSNDVVWQRDVVHALKTEAMFLNMQHAMTRVKLIFSKTPSSDPNTYLGAGKIQAVQIADSKDTPVENWVIHIDGTLDLTQDEPTITAGGVGSLNDFTEKTLSEEGVLYDFLLLPVQTIKSGGIVLNIRIDDKDLTTVFPVNTIQSWQAGTAYTYEVTVQNGESQVVFGKVGTTPWNYGGKITGDFDPSNPEYGGGDVSDWGDNGWGVEIDGQKYISIAGNFVVSATGGESTMTWEQAAAYCQEKGEGWRLPTQNELMYLYGLAPAFSGNAAFNTSADHWSATLVNGNTNNAWIEGFFNGTMNNKAKTSSSYPRCVKTMAASGRTYPYITTARDGGVVVVLRDETGGVNEAALFPDPLTQTASGDEQSTNNRMSRKFRVQKADGGTKTWANAITYCDDLVEEGHDDWRLPSQRELELLWALGGNSNVTLGYKNDAGVEGSSVPLFTPYLYQQSGFTAFTAGDYWSAFEISNPKATFGWVVHFGNGRTYGSGDKRNQYNVRCVRDEW